MFDLTFAEWMIIGFYLYTLICISNWVADKVIQKVFRRKDK